MTMIHGISNRDAMDTDSIHGISNRDAMDTKSTTTTNHHPTSSTGRSLEAIFKNKNNLFLKKLKNNFLKNKK